jgi:hypothetical protein
VGGNGAGQLAGDFRFAEGEAIDVDYADYH